jgi:tetratricopeptide (TPR) repeat protein
LTASLPAPSLALLREAAAHDARGAWREAIDAWSRLVATSPDFVPAQVGLAQAQIRAGGASDALPALERVSALAPTRAPVWLALAVARSMLGRHDDAIAAAERAVAADPGHPSVHLGLGDVLRQAGRGEKAAAAYARAVDIAPGNANALNRFAAMIRAAGNETRADALLQRALAIAPRDPHVRVNAGTLALELGEVERGERLLRDAIDDPGLPRDAGRVATDALAMLDEARALANPVELAIASDDPAPIAEALRARPRGSTPDALLVAYFDRIVDRYAGRTDIAAGFARGMPCSPRWGAIEAHHHYRDTRTRAAITASVDLAARQGAATTPVERDVASYARLVDGWRSRAVETGDPIAFEAQVRWVHARLTQHRPDRGPGRFKFGAFASFGRKALSTCRPASTQATFDVVMREMMPRLPEGPVRCAFLQVALVSMQPFHDCNTRVARFLQNRLLAQGGWFPSLRPPSGDRQLLIHAHATADLDPMIASLAAGSHEAADRDREWNATQDSR